MINQLHKTPYNLPFWASIIIAVIYSLEDGFMVFSIVWMLIAIFWGYKSSMLLKSRVKKRDEAEEGVAV